MNEEEDNNETVMDIVDELNSAEHGLVPRQCEDLSKRLMAAYRREMRNRIQVDNSMVSNTAMMLDDHIKAIVAEAKRSAIEEALVFLKERVARPLNSANQNSKS